MLANKRTMPSFETSIFYHIQLTKEGACVASSYIEIRISVSLNAEERDVALFCQHFQWYMYTKC